MRLIAYAFITAPMLLLIGRFAYVRLFGPPPLSDAAGRYITCIECGYDLRSSTSATCPECGASVIADKTNTSTAAN